MQTFNILLFRERCGPCRFKLLHFFFIREQQHFTTLGLFSKEFYKSRLRHGKVSHYFLARLETMNALAYLSCKKC